VTASTRNEPTCEEAVVLLPLVADGAIDVMADPALFAHLSRCCDCQDALAQHDLVNLALEASRPAARADLVSRRDTRHLFLPWPAALAASLAAAAGLWMWLTTLQNGRPAAPVPTTQVVQVMTEEGQPVYVVVQDGQMTVIDPRTIDGKASREASQVQAVKFITPVPPVESRR
jgi:hypothetical protein